MPLLGTTPPARVELGGSRPRAAPHVDFSKNLFSRKLLKRVSLAYSRQETKAPAICSEMDWLSLDTLEQ